MAIDDFSVGASQSEILQVREFRGDLGSEQEELENIWSEECFTSLAFMVAFLPT